MFLEEAIWIRDRLRELGVKEGDAIINIGSSTEEYRCLGQPHIDYYIFKPLRQLGLRIVHIDRVNGDGVDEVLDIASPDSDSLIKKIIPADVVLCTNLLEHVTDRDLVIERVKKLVKSRGVIILTVPHIYKYHPDPIDTLYRPSNIELERFFPGNNYSIIASCSIEVSAEAEIFFPDRNIFARILRHAARELRLNIKHWQPIIVKNKVSAVAVKYLK